MLKNDIMTGSPDDPGSAQVSMCHFFQLADDFPIYHRARHMALRKQKLVEKEVYKTLESGILVSASSAWSSPVVIVTKQNGMQRFCVDYRTLSYVIKTDPWPLRKVEDIFDEFEGSVVFSTLHLFPGYWQIKMKDTRKEMTAFVTRPGTCQLGVIRFGLIYAPETFQCMTDGNLGKIPFVRAYLDDFVVLSRFLLERIGHLRELFEMVSQRHLKLEFVKCELEKSFVELLGQIVSTDRISISYKIRTIKNASTPHETTSFKSFLGLSSYYRRFIEGFADLSVALYPSTSKNSSFKWTGEMQSAFERLKLKSTTPPVLAFPKFQKTFSLETDASGMAIGAVLLRKQKGEGLILFSIPAVN